MAQLLIGATARIFFRWKVIGRERIPKTGALIASNHLSNYDPPLLGSAIPREIYYFAKAELFKNVFIGAFLKSVYAFPVRRGETDRDAWRLSKSLLQRGKLLLFFPEGTRSKDGEIQAAKPGMARLALAAGVPVVPAAISGSNRLRDVFFRRSKLRIGFANPVLIHEFDKDDSESFRGERLTEKVMSEIKRLKAEVDAS